MSTISSISREVSEQPQVKKMRGLDQQVPIVKRAPGQPLRLKGTQENYQDVFELICSQPKLDNGIYVGFDFEFDLNILAHRNVKRAYLCSTNPRVMELYQWIDVEIKRTPNLDAFIEALRNELSTKNDHYLGAEYTLGEFLHVLTSPQESWLRNQPQYDKVRDLFLSGGVIIDSFNLRDASTLSRFSIEARKINGTFDVISLYGAGMFMPEEFERVVELCSRNTVAVQSNTSFLGQTSLEGMKPSLEPRIELFHELRAKSHEYSKDLFHGHPFLLTTETGHPEIFQALSEIPQRDNGVYFGFAFEFNYHILSRRKFQKAYICDIHPVMMNLYQWVEKTVKETASRMEFIEKFQVELFVNKKKYFPEIESISDEMLVGYLQDVIGSYTTLEYSWLFDDNSYANVRTLYRGGHIQHLSLNLARDTKKINEIATNMNHDNLKFDLVYISNIAEWVLFKDNDHFDEMIENLQTFVSEGTILVDSKREKPFTGFAASRIRRGTLPDFRFSQADEDNILSRNKRKRRTLSRSTTSSSMRGKKLEF